MNIIVAVDKNWGIGKDNRLLVSIPADMKFFPHHNHRQSGCYGKKDSGELSGRTALEKPHEHCAHKG